MQDAWFALRDLVRQRLGEPSLDGTQLMERVGDTNPKLPLTPMRTATERDMHRGVWRFLTGIAMYVRNPQMHETTGPVREDCVGALERLAIVSLCMRHVESAASPVAVGDAVSEASQPLFPATDAAVDDLIRTIPTGRRADLVDGLITAALDASDAKVAGNIRRVLHRALKDGERDDPEIAVSAQRAGALIVTDETLTQGISLLTPGVMRALPPRHRDKVALVLADDVRIGAISRRTLTAGSYSEANVRLFDGLEDQQRSQILGALQEALATHWERQAYAMRIAVRVVDRLELAAAAPLLSAMVGAIVRDNAWDASDELTDGFADMAPDKREALAAELVARADKGGPGADLARGIASQGASSSGA